MGRTKVTDGRVNDDLATLKRMRKKASIDFIQWTDDDRSRIAPIVRNQQGNHSTLQAVSGKMLAALPDEILDRQVACLEFSIDFVAKRATTNDMQDADLIRVYDLLHRRLAPWTGRYMSTRTARSKARGHYDLMISGKPLAGFRADGSYWFLDTKPRWMLPARAIGGALRAHSVYFGHSPEPSWDDWPSPPSGDAQLRLYIKVTDAGKAIKRPAWRTRMEVTLNGPALAAVLGVRTIRDLQTADMRKLMHEYLRLRSPKVDPGLTEMKRAPPAWKRMFEDRRRAIANRDVAAALAEGNFSVVEDGLVAFHPIASLDSAILACANDFGRAVARAKK